MAYMPALWSQNVVFPPSQVAQPTHQGASTDAALSPQALQLKADLIQLGRDVRKRDSSLISAYSLYRSRCRYHVAAAIKVPADFDESVLSHYGVKVNSRAGNLFTVAIPTRRFVAFVESGVVERVEVSVPAQTR